MPTKYYRLTPAAQQFIDRNKGRGDEGIDPFTFRIRFDRLVNGVRCITAMKHCPLIDVFPGQVLKTDNVTAQRMLDNFQAPTISSRRGQPSTPGALFEDVTESAPNFDIDLDSIFDSV